PKHCFMRKLLTVIVLFVCVGGMAQQNPALVDSMKLKLAKSKTSEEKVEVLGNLTRVLMQTNIAEADNYGKKLTEEAERSRDRKLMVKALLINGERYSYFSMNKEYVQKAIGYYEE